MKRGSWWSEPGWNGATGRGVGSFIGNTQTSGDWRRKKLGEDNPDQPSVAPAGAQSCSDITTSPRLCYGHTSLLGAERGILAVGWIASPLLPPHPCPSNPGSSAPGAQAAPPRGDAGLCGMRQRGKRSWRWSSKRASLLLLPSETFRLPHLRSSGCKVRAEPPAISSGFSFLCPERTSSLLRPHFPQKGQIPPLASAGTLQQDAGFRSNAATRHGHSTSEETATPRPGNEQLGTKCGEQERERGTEQAAPDPGSASQPHFCVQTTRSSSCSASQTSDLVNSKHVTEFIPAAQRPPEKREKRAD